MAGDWIKLHRKFADHPIMQHDGLCRLWIHCLMRANWKPSTWLIPGTTRTVDMPRGAFITGRKALHKTLYPNAGDKRELPAPSESTLWRWLLSLEAMGCVKLENVDNRCTMVTVCKYVTYQADDRAMRTAGEQLPDNCRTAGEQPVNTEEERNNSSLSLSLSAGRVFDLQGRFNTPEVQAAFQLWARHYADKRPGSTLTDVEVAMLCKNYASAGWTPDKLVRGIEYAISRASKNILDPDEQDRNAPPAPKPPKPVPTRIEKPNWKVHQ